MAQDGDAVALFNFRSDRMVEISKAFEYEDFNAFDRKRFPKVSSCSARFSDKCQSCLLHQAQTVQEAAV